MSALVDLFWNFAVSIAGMVGGFGALAARTTPDGGAVDDAGAVDGASAGREGGVEIAGQFLFAIPDEVKTGVMLVLAAAIGIYLYINFTRDRP